MARHKQLSDPLDDHGLTRLAPDPHLRAQEFSRRLAKAMRDKGWRQVDLARAAFGVTTTGDGRPRVSGRDHVSTYITGKRVPNDHNLHKLATALGVEPNWLLPSREMIAVGDETPEVSIHQVPGGRVRLRCDVIVSKRLAARFYGELVADLEPPEDE